VPWGLGRSSCGECPVFLREEDLRCPSWSRSTLIRQITLRISRQESRSGSWDAIDDSPVPDLRKYESALEGDEEYHQRMVTNFLATVVVIVLMVGGGWVVSTLVMTTREGGDCYRSGASTCAAVYMPGNAADQDEIQRNRN